MERKRRAYVTQKLIDHTRELEERKYDSRTICEIIGVSRTTLAQMRNANWKFRNYKKINSMRRDRKKPFEHIEYFEMPKASNLKDNESIGEPTLKEKLEVLHDHQHVIMEMLQDINRKLDNLRLPRVLVLDKESNDPIKTVPPYDPDLRDRSNEGGFWNSIFGGKK